MRYAEGILRARQAIEPDVFDYQALTEALSRYRKPRDKITKLLASGAVVRIRKGLYCFGEALRRAPVSREYLANVIYGPSYVSIEYALAYHGLIPERVNVMTSVTPKRSRTFDTPFGRFSYRMLTDDRYSVGAILTQANGPAFLLATPEKALIDKVWTDKRFPGDILSDYGPYLSEDLRIDEEAMSHLDLSRIQTIAARFDSAKIDNLVRFLRRSVFRA